MPNLPATECIELSEGNWLGDKLVACIERNKVYLLRDGTFCREKSEVEAEGRELRSRKRAERRRKLDTEKVNRQ